MDEFCKETLPNGIPDSLDGLSSEGLVCVLHLRTQITADTTNEIIEIIAALNVFDLILAGALVFFMQAGFTMLCAGCVRPKNVRNIMFKNFFNVCGGAIGFWSIGYAFAYGDSDPSFKSFIGNKGFFLRGYNSGADYIGWFFQFTFAASAATIVAGTVAERCKMVAYLCYSLMLTGFVYPVIVHSIWASSGFLSAFNGDPFAGVGVIDFAGSGVVHLTGGATALIAAKILGPRRGRFYDEYGNPLDEPGIFQPNSVALQMLGTFILWFGWYGFNPGSALLIEMNKDDVAALCAVNTTVAAASGCVVSCFTDSLLLRWKTGETEYDLSKAMNGALGALVGITAGCSVVTPGMAVLIGIIAGWIYLGFSNLLLKLRIDDAVDAIPVHFANGMWGLLAVGLFAEPERTFNAYGQDAHVGWFYSWGRGSGDAHLLGAQVVAILWIIGWVTFIMCPYFLVLKYAGMFRVDLLEEEIGLDVAHHKGVEHDFLGVKREVVTRRIHNLHEKNGVEVCMELEISSQDETKAEVEVEGEGED